MTNRKGNPDMANSRVTPRSTKATKRAEVTITSGIHRAAKRAGIRRASALRSDLYEADRILGDLAADLLRGTEQNAVQTLGALRRLDFVRGALNQIAEEVEYLPVGAS
jgi:hypothetical protein